MYIIADEMPPIPHVALPFKGNDSGRAEGKTARKSKVSERKTSRIGKISPQELNDEITPCTFAGHRLGCSFLSFFPRAFVFWSGNGSSHLCESISGNLLAGALRGGTIQVQTQRTLVADRSSLRRILAARILRVCRDGFVKGIIPDNLASVRWEIPFSIHLRVVLPFPNGGWTPLCDQVFVLLAGDSWGL